MLQVAAAVVIHNIQNNKIKATFSLKLAEVKNSFEKCKVLPKCSSAKHPEKCSSAKHLEKCSKSCVKIFEVNKVLVETLIECTVKTD